MSDVLHRIVDLIGPSEATRRSAGQAVADTDE